MMQQFLNRVLEAMEGGESIVLVSIVASQGSTPRGIGAIMAVGPKGVVSGTIGGGELEYRCAQLALHTPQPLHTFSLNHQEAAALGMVCGGSTQVLFTPVKDVAVLRQALCAKCLLLPLSGGEPLVSTVTLPQFPTLTEHQGQPCLSIPLADPGRIFLLGGGHVALELSRLLDVLGYSYVVVDDREEFSTPHRFPDAQQTWTIPFSALEETLTGAFRPSAQDCICIMTRGHLEDSNALRFALRTPAGYIGVMGSRRKREQIFTTLTSEGFSDVAQRVVTPIGLPIGGQTPAEIAISIAAQLVQVRFEMRLG